MAAVGASEWFAVQVWAGREAFGAQHLRARGYQVFLPCYVERRRWSDRIKTITRALFDGYVFCRLEAGIVGTVVSTPGVIRIVGDQQGPIPIPSQEIESLQRIAETRLATQPWPFLRAGQRVRIQAGPLRGLEGLVLTIKNEHCLIVSISLLQRSVAVEIAPEWVAIGEPSAFDWRIN